MRIFGLQKALVTAETIQQYQEQLSTLTKHSPFWQGYSKRGQTNSSKLADQWGLTAAYHPPRGHSIVPYPYLQKGR